MARTVDTEIKMNAIHLILLKDELGNPLLSQREIEKETGLSRQFLRKLSKSIGLQHPRNGIELKGQICICVNCDLFYYKNPSRAKRVQKTFCSTDCRIAYFKGPLHPNYKTGITMRSWSSWVKNQSGYKVFRESALERAGYKCEISGREDNLHVHHIFPKAEEFNPEKSFDIKNALVVNEEVHRELHKLIHEGHSFEGSIEVLKNKYGQ